MQVKFAGQIYKNKSIKVNLANYLAWKSFQLLLYCLRSHESTDESLSPQPLTVSHRVFTAMFVLRAAIVPSGETTQNKTGDISMTEHTTQIYLRFSSYKSVLKVCKQDTRPALELVCLDNFTVRWRCQKYFSKSLENNSNTEMSKIMFSLIKKNCFADATSIYQLLSLVSI